MSVFGELRPSSIVGLSNLDILDTITATQVLAANLYTKAQTDALISASVPTISEGSLTVAMVGGLQATLDDSRDTQLATQASLGSTSQALVYAQEDLVSLTSLVDTKASQADINNGLLTRATLSSLVAGLSTKQNKLDSFSEISISSYNYNNA